MRPPIIALDYTPAYEQGGGIGRYVRELTAALAQQPLDAVRYRLFVAGATHADLPPLPSEAFSWHPTRITPKWLARIWHRARLPLPTVEAFTGRVTMYHATDFVLPPVLPGTRTLLTVHDLSFARVPESAAPSLKAYLDAVVPRSVRRADHILADSQATKADLIALYHTPPTKISVLLSGVEARFRHENNPSVLLTMRIKYKLGDRPYILAVGTVQPRKNYVRLAQALAQIRTQHDIGLVIVGGKGWLDAPIYTAIRDLGLSDVVHFTGFADEADLPALYSGAVCVALPSLYEGFGIPILEAIACGVPVVTSNLSSLPEVAGDAALLINPYDVEALTHALNRLITDSDLRTTLIARGDERVKQFTWDSAAQQLRQIYAALLA
ncbi:MAG: glycosyltransferase family 4 protein [Armatimonadetes bacterium]|nr:glycosyltransferase family 4 protein [Anaerolineae bacterium]